MTPEQIQTAIRAKGLTQQAIARKLNRAEMSLSYVIHRTTVSDYIMRGIAKAIGKKHTAVFPEYYLNPAKRSTSKTVVNFYDHSSTAQG